MPRAARNWFWLMNTKGCFTRVIALKLASPAGAVVSTGDLNANSRPNSDDLLITQLCSRFRLTNFVKFRGKYLWQSLLASVPVYKNALEINLSRQGNKHLRNVQIVYLIGIIHFVRTQNFLKR